MSELVPCPWCKEKPELIESILDGFAYACGDPHNDHYVETGWCKTEEEARAIWNKCGEKNQ